MFYSILFLLFVLMFIISVWSRREYRGLAISMGWVLFLLVALRDINVGSDTYGYVQAFLDPNYMGSDIRDIEGLFKKWQDFWRIILPGGQLYLVVCAFFSVGLVLLSMWKSSSNRIWSYTLFVVAFSWYFYLSGIRQSLAMGCFTYGTYLLCRNINDVLVLKWKDLFRRENLWAIVFLLVSPLFHTTAIFAISEPPGIPIPLVLYYFK